MTAIEVLFAVVLVGAVPLGVATIDLGDDLADAWVARLRRTAPPASLMLAIAVFLAPGPLAAALALPWQLVAGLLALAGLAAVTRLVRRAWAWRRFAVAVSLGFLAFGAANATSFAAGFGPLGFAPPIILLTAVHFHAAGFVLMTAGILAGDRRSSAAAHWGVACVGIGSVVTATGFVGIPGAAVAGAVTVALGGLLIGWASIRVALELRSLWGRRLLAVAGVSLFVSMPLAIAWAIGTQLGLPPFALDVMVRTHGTINALAVTVPAMAGWALEARG